MKKLSIILLALAVGLFMAVPAMAIHIGDERDPREPLALTVSTSSTVRKSTMTVTKMPGTTTMSTLTSSGPWVT